MDSQKLDEILKGIAVNNSKLDESNRKLDEIKTEISAIKGRLTAVEDKQKELEEAQNSTEKKMVEGDKNLQEQIDQIRKASNLMIFNVEETDAALSLAKEALHIILPDHKEDFNLLRMKAFPNSTSNKPPPIRVFLSSPAERSQALKNKSLLKGLDQFKSISISADMTKNQQQKYSMRSPYRTRKRASEMAEAAATEDGAKKHRTGTAANAMDIEDEDVPT